MKTFIAKQEIRDLLNQVIMDEVSFTRMVEIMNERVNERVSERVSGPEGPCVEDIPKLKLKPGDKVRIKHGISSKTHYNIDPGFVEGMDDLLGKTMTVGRYIDGDNYVACDGYYFAEEWLEPYEELKKGDLAIFWEEKKKYATIRIYDQSTINESEGYLRHKDNIGSNWKNAIKFESKEQYERLIRGEI